MIFESTFFPRFLKAIPYFLNIGASLFLSIFGRLRETNYFHSTALFSAIIL